MIAKTSEPSNFRPEIHAMRVLAVSLVVLFHVRLPGFQGGFIGVDIFFVISGFLITGSLLDEATTTNRINFLQFYARRSRRLLPAATVVILATLLASFWLLAPLARLELVRSAVSSSTYVSNLYFAITSLDYLSGDVHGNPFLHTWSLSVEEQFYLVWPLLIFASVRLWGRKGESAKRNIATTIAVVAAVSLLSSILLIGKSQPWVFFGSPFRAWEFALGGLARVLEIRLARHPRTSIFLAVSGFSAISICAIFYTESTVFPGVMAIPPVLGAAAIAATGCSLGRFRKQLDRRVIRTVGELSYSWYLWHWPFLVLPELAWGELTLSVRLALGLASLLAAWATYHWIENPIRFHPSIARFPGRSIALGVVFPGLSVAAAIAFHLHAKHIMDTPPQDKVWMARNSIPVVYADKCHLDFQSASASGCVYGDPSGDSTVMLYGDSHAASWFPPIDSICRRRGYKLISLTKSYCTPALFTAWAPLFHRAYWECETWHLAILDRIRAERPFLVILGSYTGYTSDSTGYRDSTRWKDSWRSLFDSLASFGSATVVIRDIPESDKDIPNCLSNAYWKGRPESTCDFPSQKDSAAQPSEIPSFTEYGTRHIDLTNTFCDKDKCLSVVNGIPVYSDAHHLTIPFSRSLSGPLEIAIFGEPAGI